MKKNLFTLVSISLIVLSGCDKIVQKSSLYKTTKSQLDSVTIVAQNQDAELEEICKTIDDVVLGIQAIQAEKEALAVETSGEVELNAASKERVAINMQAISLAIKKYEEKIKKLEAKVKQTSTLQNIIRSLKLQLAEKDSEMEALVVSVSEKDAEMQEILNKLKLLESENSTLSQDLENATKQVDSQKNIINQKDRQLNTAYYVIGKQKELTSSGILVKKKISSKLDTKKFTTIDIREVKEINLGTKKKITLLSNHPEGSYQYKEDIDGVKILRIKNIKEFWSQSKYLIVVTK